MKLTFDKATGQYYNGEKLVSRTTVLGELDKLIEKASKQSDALIEKLRAGQISLGEWQAQMMRLISDAHHTAEAIGAGGLKAVEDYVRKQTELSIQHQAELLNRYSTRIEAGVAPIHKGWARQYVRSSRTSFYNAELLRLQENGDNVIIRWIRTAKESCPGCIEASKQSYYPSDCPEIGSHQCGNNCRCYLVYEKVRPVKEGKKAITPPLAPPKPEFGKKTPQQIEGYLKQQMQTRLEQAKARLQALAGGGPPAVPPTPPLPPAPPAKPVPYKLDKGESIGAHVFTERSDVILTAEQKKLRDVSIKDALKTINQAHGDGGLTHRVGVMAEPAMQGEVGIRGNFDPISRIVRFDPNLNPIEVKATIVHELGHYIDRELVKLAGSEGWHASQTVAYTTGRRLTAVEAAFGELKQAIENSRAMGTISTVWAHDQNYLIYLKTNTELFARAYTQTVANLSKDERMMLLMAERVAKGYQWAEDDFREIEDKMVKVFKALGWKVNK